MERNKSKKKSPTKATIETTVKLAMECCQEINKIIFFLSKLVPGILAFKKSTALNWEKMTPH